MTFIQHDNLALDFDHREFAEMGMSTVTSIKLYEWLAEDISQKFENICSVLFIASQENHYKTFRMSFIIILLLYIVHSMNTQIQRISSKA